MWLFKLSISCFSIFPGRKRMLQHYWGHLVIKVDHPYLHQIALEHSRMTSHSTRTGHRKKRNSSELLLPLQFKEWWRLSADVREFEKNTGLWAFALSLPQQAPAALCSAQQAIRHAGSNVMTHVACSLLPSTLITSFCNIPFVRIKR